MSVLTDIVMAKASEAEAVLTDYPQRDWPHLDARGLDTLKLGDLYAALLNDGSDADELSEAFEPIAHPDGDDEEGPWLMPMPNQLTGLLVMLRAEQIAAVVARWLAADEPPDWPEDALIPWLRQLSQLAARAQADQSSADPLQLFVWISL